MIYIRYNKGIYFISVTLLSQSHQLLLDVNICIGYTYLKLRKVEHFNYQTMSNIRAHVRSKFTKEELEMYRAHFDIFDLNGDGMVSGSELDKVSSHLGYRLTRQDIKVGLLEDSSGLEIINNTIM